MFATLTPAENKPPAEALARARTGLLDRTVAPGVLIAGIIGWLGLDLLLLLRFIGFDGAGIYLAGALIVAALCVACMRMLAPFAANSPTLRCLACCALAAFILLLLGGEGRLFYANVDWQVRDAVARDMAIHPWPYAYTARGLPELLRAPIGMYLVPALAAKAGGPIAGDIALLGQNGLLLTALLGLGSTLFASVRARAIALAVFLAFSGMDVVGQYLTGGTTGTPFADHLEWWAGIQYSSHITLAFWVPQHALAGWLCALGFLLWRDGRMPLGIFLALVPLSILWSPLAAMGALPFAALAGVMTVLERKLAWRDIALPLGATLLSVPALLYLGAAADSVDGHVASIPFDQYLLFELLEVIPLLAVVALCGPPGRLQRTTLALIAACLLLMPWWQVGRSADFMMRAAIVPLALLSIAVARMLADKAAHGRAIAMLLLAVGSVTGASEIRRSLTQPPSPRPLCSFFGAAGPGEPGGKSTYLAPVERLPASIRPAQVTLIPPGDPSRCWNRPWLRPLGV